MSVRDELIDAGVLRPGRAELLTPTRTAATLRLDGPSRAVARKHTASHVPDGEGIRQVLGREPLFGRRPR